MRHTFASYFFAFTLSLPSSAAPAGNLARVHLIADQVAASVHQYLDAVETLGARVTAGEATHEEFMRQFGRLTMAYEEGAATRSPAALFAAAPNLSPLKGRGSRRLSEMATLATSVTALTAVAIAGGVAYWRFVSPAFDGAGGSLAHLGASVAAGTAGTIFTVTVLTTSAMLVARGLARLQKWRLARSGTLDEASLRKAYFKRLRERGITLDHGYVVRIEDFGGPTYRANQEGLARVAARLLTEIEDPQDRATLTQIVSRGFGEYSAAPRLLLVGLVMKYNLNGAYPLRDLLTFGSRPIAGRCNSLL